MTPTRGSGTSTSSAASARTTWSRSAYVGSQGRQMVIKVDINQAPPVIGVTDANVNRPFIKLAPAVRSLEPVAEHRQAGLQRPAGEVPAPLREQLLVPELVHVRQVDGLRVGQRGGDHQYVYDLQYNWGPVRLRRPAHVRLELDLRDSVGARTSCTAAGSSAASCTARRAAADGHAVAGRALDRHRQPAEPDLRRHLSTRPSTSGSICPASRRRPRHTGTYGNTGRGTIRGPARSTSTRRSPRTPTLDTFRRSSRSRRSTC